MPAASCFVATNILLYAISTDAVEALKTAEAQRLLTNENWGWSAQVAAEFINASTSPRRPRPLSLAEAESWIDSWLSFPMTAVDGPMVKYAIHLALRYQIAYFDAQVIAAAKRLGCSVMYSEDLNHGQNYDGVRIISPFLIP